MARLSEYRPHAGKTRFALSLVAETQCRYQDEVSFVELAPVADPALVPQAGAAVDVTFGPARVLAIA
jgi:predicted ATPase